MKEADFEKELHDAFQIETGERLIAFSNQLIGIEKASGPQERAQFIEIAFREAHTIKGAARAVNASGIERVAHAMENVFSDLKTGKTNLTLELLNILHEAADTLGRLLTSSEEDTESLSRNRISRITGQLERRQAFIHPKEDRKGKRGGEGKPSQGLAFSPPIGEAASAASITRPDAPVPQTIRVSTVKLDALFRKVEELLPFKAAFSEHLGELRASIDLLGKWRGEGLKMSSEISPQRGKPFENVNENGPNGTDQYPSRLREFLNEYPSRIGSLERRLSELANTVEERHRVLRERVDDLHEEVKQILLLPFSNLLRRFPKVVRDLSRGQDKKVDLVVEGEETEIDKRILEAIADPLLHLVRNCIDHGLEKPQERKKKKKPPRGTLSIKISQGEGNKVEMLIGDDGRGIDLSSVRETAFKLGIVEKRTTEGRKEAALLNLIFQSGFSTSLTVTDLSGRGIGLAIARERIEEMGGAISVETKPGKGTTFLITLPVTIANVRGLIVSVSQRLFIIPTRNVERTMRIGSPEIRRVENRETISLRRKVLPLVSLGSLLKLPLIPREVERNDKTKFPVLLLKAKGKQLACRVDAILSEEEVVVKPMGRQLQRVRNISGAAILGSGQLVPVLKAADLVKSAAGDDGAELTGGSGRGPRPAS